MSVPRPKLDGPGAAQRGEFRVMPSRGDSLPVVDPGGVRFQKKNGSSGRTRTYNPPVTRTLGFLSGSDYLIARLVN